MSWHPMQCQTQSPPPSCWRNWELDAPSKPRLSEEERHKLLIAALKKDGGLEWLKSWPPKWNMEHDIELLDHKPFKERFRRIAPLLVEEVQQHIQEMLDGAAICPSQSPWCNAVVLVRKKDGSFHFCIDFRCLNAKTKKDTYPLLRMQETMESMVGARHFSCMDLKSGFW